MQFIRYKGKNTQLQEKLQAESPLLTGKASQLYVSRIAYHYIP